MTKFSKNFIAAMTMTASLLVGTASYADTLKGVYLNAESGAVLTQTQHSSIAGSSSQVGHAQGFFGNLGVGYSFEDAPGLRVQVDGDFFQTHVNRVSPNIAHGHNRNFGAMFSVLYDVDLKRNFDIDSIFTPYVGVSSGYLVNQYNVRSVRGISGTQGSFAYGGIIGTRINTPVENLYVNVDYRMIGQTMSKDSYHYDDSHFDNKFNHIFSMGVTYSFGGTLKPKFEEAVAYSPLPVLPALQRTYIVFFDWNKTNLSGMAQEIVDRAAIAAQKYKTTHVSVTGYSDNSMLHPGTKSGQEYNMKLSISRAKTVAAELVKKGISPSEIFVQGKGDTFQFVKTAPNTREALNRRVVIEI